MAAFNTVIKRQRTTGAVRNLSSAISMARSYAVAKNRKVALIIPDNDIGPSGNIFTSANKSKFYDGGSGFPNGDKKYWFSSYGICYLDNNDKFVEWATPDQLRKLPNGVSVYIKLGADEIKAASRNIIFTDKDTGKPLGIDKASGLIFRPSGCLQGTGNKQVNALPARFEYNSDPSKRMFIYIGKSKHYWRVIINPFTGRASYENDDNEQTND